MYTYIYIQGIGFSGWKGRISIDKLSRWFATRNRMESKLLQSLGGGYVSSDPLPAQEDPARYLRGGEGRERVISRIDRPVFVRSPSSSLPPSYSFRRTRGATTIDTWRGRREGGAGEGKGRVAPHISLISVSIVVSVGTTQPTRPTTVAGEGPTVHPSSRLLLVSSSCPTLPFLPRPLVYTLFFLGEGREFRNREIGAREEGRLLLFA